MDCEVSLPNVLALHCLLMLCSGVYTYYGRLWQTFHIEYGSHLHYVNTTHIVCRLLP